MRELWRAEDGNTRLLFDPSNGLLRLLRTANYVRPEEIESFRAQVPALVGDLRWAITGLLIDVRQAIGRNDDPFEQASARLLQTLATQVPRIAVLTSTTIGRMQVQRTQRVHGVPLQGFQDELSALEFLLEAKEA